MKEQKSQGRIHRVGMDGQITADGARGRIRHIHTISRQVRGRDPGRPPCRCPSRVRPRNVRAVHAGARLHPRRNRGSATSILGRPVHSTHHGDYAEAEESQNAIAVTSTATRPDESHAARHCGILGIHGDGPYSRHVRRPGSVDENPRKGDWSHAECHQLPRALAPAPAISDLVLAPILAPGLDRGVLVRGRVQAARSC